MKTIVCGNCNQTLMQNKTESERFCPKGTIYHANNMRSRTTTAAAVILKCEYVLGIVNKNTKKIKWAI